MLTKIKNYLFSKLNIGEMNKQLRAADDLIRDVASFTVFNQVPGDYFEFGVYKGDALLRTNYWINRHWKDFKSIGSFCNVDINYNDNYCMEKSYFAFDSFKGLPESKETDKPIHFVEGAYGCSLKEFEENIYRKKIVGKVIPVKGWYRDTLTDENKELHSIDKAAIIFIDCDLYESASDIMPFITSLIQDGTVIILDDYFRYTGHPAKGVQGAFKAWVDKNNHIHTQELTRCSANRVAFVCNIVNK